MVYNSTSKQTKEYSIDFIIRSRFKIRSDHFFSMRTTRPSIGEYISSDIQRCIENAYLKGKQDGTKPDFNLLSIAAAMNGSEPFVIVTSDELRSLVNNQYEGNQIIVFITTQVISTFTIWIKDGVQDIFNSAATSNNSGFVCCLSLRSSGQAGLWYIKQGEDEISILESRFNLNTLLDISLDLRTIDAKILAFKLTPYEK